jgi:ssDNA-binding Zn-finger/Zn-ribbon topoisomerase 1
MPKNITTEKWIEKAIKIHGDKYDYSKVEYINNRTPVCIICPEHGEFYQVPYAHLAGKGCPICGKIKKAKSKTSNTDEWIKKAIKIHGYTYDYSVSKYNGAINKIDILCKKHGIFSQRACDHLSGYGCPKCGYEKVSADLLSNKENFVKKANKIYSNKYTYDKFVYINNKTPSYVTCPKHGDFLVRPDNHLTGRNGCPQCTAEQSRWEIEINDFLKENNINIIENDRSVLKNNFELDVLCKDKNIAIEYDGLYWHCEKFKDKRYHINKTNECLKNGIKLIHIFEDEWANKKEIVKSRLKNVFGVNTEKIYARKCKINEVSSADTKKFLDANHIQGNIYGKINFGLYFNDELVSVMTFGSKRKNLGSTSIEGEYEMLRFCSKLNTNVVGAASKLFKYFIKKYKPIKVISYCDLRWGDGNLYRQLGFNLLRISEPNYFYINGLKRSNRFLFRKDVLIKEGFDKNKTEHEIMLERGIYRIYDCGCTVYEYINKGEP